MPLAGRALVALATLILMSCGAAFEEMRPAGQAVIVPMRMAGTFVPVTEEEARDFMRRTLAALPKTEAEVRALMQSTSWDSPLPRRLGSSPRPARIVPAIGEPLSPGALVMARQYSAWCDGRGLGRDCSGALRGGQVLDAEGRYKIAFDIALTATWSGFAAELRGMVDPVTVKAVLLTAMVIYMATIALPELTTKVVAAGITAVLTAYMGAQAVYELVFGWIEMIREANAATTFGQLRAAGERYGQRIGIQAARILVMVITVAIAEGGLVARALGLPKAAQASVALKAETGGRLGLGAVTQVSGAVVAEGGVTLVLAPGQKGAQSVANIAKGAQAIGMPMAAMGNPGDAAPSSAEPVAPKKEPGEWRKAKNPARGRAGKYQQQITGHLPDEAYMVNGVEFDGYDPTGNVLIDAKTEGGVLLDAKGAGYDRFFEENLKPKSWYENTGAEKLREQALRQVRAAPGIRIRWHIAEEKAANAIRELLKTNSEMRRIEVIHTPMVP